jgi:hypothetical protein
MATSLIALTTTLQQVAPGACLAQPSANVLFGFGATEPTILHNFLYTYDERVINYNGGYGAIWMKVHNPSTPTSVTVTVA